MKHWYVGLAILVAFLLGRAFAQDEEMKWTPPEWMRKTAEHEKLAKSVGEFDVKGEVFTAPGADPMPFTGTSVRTSIKNGFFVQEEFTGAWMGQPFHGTLIQGYDPFRKKHVSVWFDDGSPTLSVRTGEEKDGRIVMEGSDPDPVLDKLVGMKSVAEEKDGKMVLEMFRVVDGKDVLHMRMTYTRKS
jgi:hypothetical protein